MKARCAAIRILLVSTLAVFEPGLGCKEAPTPVETPTPTPSSLDVEGPEIAMTPIPDGQPLGVAVPMTATLTDPSGISSARLYYRAPGTDYWGSGFFSHTEGDRYDAEIPASFVQADGVDYYVQATDNSPARNSSFWPADGAAAPLHFDTERISGVFPYTATFEPEEAVDAWDLEATGWRSYVVGFDDDLNWHLCDDAAYSGTYSACHDHGSPYQTSEFLDYLVSPPIDLSGAKQVDLWWMEFADYSQYAQHQLLVSTGHPNPSSGDYVVVLDPLPVAPEAEGAWARSLHVDLSEFAGEPRVYVAFSYRGMWGDDWYVDQVTLAEPVPDLRFSSPVLAPSSVDPGETAEVRVNATNAGLVPSGPLTATVSSPDGQITISPSQIDLPGVDPGATVSVGPFQVQVDDAHATDLYVPITVTLSDASGTWEQDARIQVGQPPVARIDITHEFEDDLQVYLGYGPPDDPSLLITVQEDEGEDASGTFHWDVDISAYGDALPPNTTDHRWFLQVWDDSVGNTGRIESFFIQIGGEIYQSTGLPEPIPDDTTPVEVYIPGRAELELRTVRADPTPVAPGVEESLQVVVNNTSAPPGTITAELLAVSDDVTLLESGPVTMTYTATPDAGDGVTGVLSHDVPFRFRVAEAHTDSSPILFNLLMTDGLDRWSIPVSVDVPYPVLQGLTLEIEDSFESGTVDNALEPGETAWLRLAIRNTGDLSTFGPVEATVRIVSDSGTGAMLDPSSVLFHPDPTADVSTGEDLSGETPTPSEGPLAAPIPAGSGGKSDPVSLGVSSGVSGDTVKLEIVVSDGTVERSEERILVLSEPPWNPLTPGTDPAGDAGGYPIDLSEGRFRLSGSVLDMTWSSHTAFDIEETYLYAFLSGSPAYAYAIVFVYGEARLYRWYLDEASGVGYWYRRYTVPASLTGVQPDPYKVELSIDLADLGLAGGPLFGGASAGACEGGLACDYAPDSAGEGEGLTRFHW